jgi:hypothetical protein
MHKSRLNLDELEVTSFDTTATFAYSPIIATPTDPTEQTHCFVCPVYTEGCY